MSENEIPSWLDASFLQRVLHEIEETVEEIKPVNVRCNEAIPAGNNFLSDVFRVIIEYRPPGEESVKMKSLFVKIPLVPEDKERIKFLDKFQVYERETVIYNKILPKMYLLHPSRIAPQSFSSIPAKNSLVLEDLSQQGYITLNRLKQMDFQECYHFFVALAEFHAVSVKLYKKEPDLIKNIGCHGFYNHTAVSEKQKELDRKRAMGQLKDFSTALSEIGCERYARLVKEKSDSYWEYVVGLMKPGKQLNVLCHGDCWVSNILFKHENEQIVDTKLVDFQLSFYNSFAVDILVFWWSSANEKVRENHRDELFEVYRSTLNKTLEELKCGENLTKEEFDSEMKRFASFSIHVISFTAPVCLADPEDFFDMKTYVPGDIDSTDSPMMKNLRSKYYTALLPKLMEQGESFGMFMF